MVLRETMVTAGCLVNLDPRGPKGYLVPKEYLVMQCWSMVLPVNKVPKDLQDY